MIYFASKEIQDMIYKGENSLVFLVGASFCQKMCPAIMVTSFFSQSSECMHSFHFFNRISLRRHLLRRAFPSRRPSVRCLRRTKNLALQTLDVSNGPPLWFFSAFCHCFENIFTSRKGYLFCLPRVSISNKAFFNPICRFFLALSNFFQFFIYLVNFGVSGKNKRLFRDHSSTRPFGYFYYFESYQIFPKDTLRIFECLRFLSFVRVARCRHKSIL